MKRTLIHTRISPYPLYRRALAPAAQQAHQSLLDQTTSLQNEIALMRLLLEELLVEDSGCDTKAINIYARTIGRLVHIQAEINKAAQGDVDFVRKLAEDLRAFSDNVPAMMPGGAMFGQDYKGHEPTAYKLDGPEP